MNARSEHEASYHHTAEFAERVRLKRRVGNVDQREHVAGATSSGLGQFRNRAALHASPTWP